MKPLSRKNFIVGLEYLKAYYRSIKPEFFKDTMVQKVWYEALSHIDDNAYLYLIKAYSVNNIFPPQSPTHLLEEYKKLLNDRADEILKRVTTIQRTYLTDSPETLSVHVDYERAINDERDPFIKKLLNDYIQRNIEKLDKETIEEYIVKERQPLAIE